MQTAETISAGITADSAAQRQAWLVVVASSVGLFLHFGSLLVNAFGVFLTTLCAEFGWSRTQVSLSFTLATLTASAVMQRLTLILWEYTGGEEGLADLTPLVRSPVAFYYLALGVLVVTATVLLALAASRWGILLRAIRGDDCRSSLARSNARPIQPPSLPTPVSRAECQISIELKCDRSGCG